MTDVFLVFSTTEWPLSKAIRALTKSKVSHCSIWFSVFGVELVLQASVGGVKFALANEWSKHNKIIRKFRFNVDVTRGIQSALTLLNQKYDYIALLGYIPVMIAHWFGIKTKNWLASPNAVVCSEFILHVDAFDQIPEWSELEWETTTPQQLLDACSTSFDEIPI